MPVAILTEGWSLFLEVPCERRGDSVIHIAAGAFGRDRRDLVGRLPHGDAETPAGGPLEGCLLVAQGKAPEERAVFGKDLA